MPDQILPLIEKVRKLLSGYSSNTFTFQNLAKELDVPIETLIQAFKNEAGLVAEVLDYEQQNLEDIFHDLILQGSMQLIVYW